MVEVPLGEYDGRFAAVVAAIFTLLAVIVMAIVATQVISDIIIATPIPADASTPDADSAARSARATSALLIGIGIILLLAAAPSRHSTSEDASGKAATRRRPCAGPR